MDIPVPEGSPVYAIDDGKVKIAGAHAKYSDLIVQVSIYAIIYFIIIIYNDIYNFCICICSWNTQDGLNLLARSFILTTSIC